MRFLNYFRWLAIAVVLPLPAFAATTQTNLSVFADQLANEFQDRSWAAHSLTNTTPVHSGEFSINVNAATNWQGIYFYHPDFDSSPYDSISFWINGGSGGGQTIQVQGLLGNATPLANVYYRVELSSNVWQRVTVPLSSIGVEDKTNFTGFWIQLTPGGSSNTFFVDDVQLDAKSAPVIAEAVVKTAQLIPSPTPTANPNSDQTILWIVGALAVIIALLGCLVFLFWRRGAVDSPTRAGQQTSALTTAEKPTDAASLEEWKQRALAAEAMAGKQGQMLREKIMPELTEFAKQSLVQGLYAQRSVLLETQQKAQQALAQLESQLTSLHLPLQERIRAYEQRVAELEKEVETQGAEVRELTRATLALVRKKLEDERELGRISGRFN